MPRRAARVDANHLDICHALRKHGCSVQSLAAIGKGVPDIVLAIGGVTYLAEIKDKDGRNKKCTLTPDQVKFHENWKSEILRFNCLDDALEWVKDVRQSLK
jgi:Holliday junction resolvase